MAFPLFINIRGRLMDLSVPKVMGILNVTPDSFFDKSRTFDEGKIRERVVEMVNQGVDIIDVGGCSTRPGYEAPSPEEEWKRVELGCRLVKEITPEIPLSVDTFRADVADMAIRHFRVDIINDVSGGTDSQMWKTVAANRVAYVLTHNRPDGCMDYADPVADVITELAKKISELHRFGLNDVIIDPGFGFAKSLEQNFLLLKELDELSRMGLPILIGVSRKSMIYKTLNVSPSEALTGSIALQAFALMKGADILRVHDVKPAVETVKLFEKLI